MSLSSRRAWASSTCRPVRAWSSRWWWPSSTTFGWIRTWSPSKSVTMSSSSTSNPRSLSRSIRCSIRHISPAENSSSAVSSDHSASYRSASRSMNSCASTWPSSESLAWRSSSSAKTFSQPTVMSYSPHARGEAGLELAGLRVDEVRREPAGAASEQHVGQGHVAPVEVREVQPDQQDDQGVDQRRQVLGLEAVREQAAVRQREPQVLGHQRRRQRRRPACRPAR